MHIYNVQCTCMYQRVASTCTLYIHFATLCDGYLILSRSPNCRSNLRRSSSMMSCCFSARPALPASPPGSSSTLRAHSSRSFNWPFSCSISSERCCCWASVEPYTAAHATTDGGCALEAVMPARSYTVHCKTLETPGRHHTLWIFQRGCNPTIIDFIC